MCIYNGVSSSIQSTLVPSTVHFEPLKRGQPLLKGHYLNVITAWSLSVKIILNFTTHKQIQLSLFDLSLSLSLSGLSSHYLWLNRAMSYLPSVY